MKALQNKVPSIISAIALVAALVSPGAVHASDGAPVTIRRFALVAGVNDGGADRVALKFATSDAQAVAEVLEELGGVSTRDSMLLNNPTRAELLAAFSQMEAKIAAAKGGQLRLEVLFYYSGHSDEEGLLIEGQRFKYSEIKAQIQKMPADVRIAVVDSCASGALTRQKGGTRRPPFLLDSSGDVRGYAILTSSSADEAAQESDRVGASFFTHYLISGLRGAADTSRDGRVTLDEAYHHAFHETLSRTESTQAGPQHANYDFQLAGSGDLVLTDIRGTSAMLTLPKELDGRVFIRDADGKLVAEINKPGGAPMSLGLAPGDYVVTVKRPATIAKGRVTLKEDQMLELTVDQLEEIDAESTVVRGDAPGEGAPESEEILHRPVSLGLAPGATTDGGAPHPVRNNFSLNFIGWGDFLTGAELSFLGTIRKRDVKGAQLGGLFNVVRGEMIGAQLGGILNMAGGDFKGLQLGGIANINEGISHGAQFGGIYNNSGGDLVGGQFSGIANYSGGHTTGLQVGGIANVSLKEVKGLQVGGIANYSGGYTTGLQVGGIANVSLKEVKGLQLGGIANQTPSVMGAQISGIANVAQEKMTGLQLSLVNVGGVVTGTQVGLVNVAAKEMKGAQIGLINFAQNGIFAPTVFVADDSLLNLGLKMGGPHVYTLFGGGLDPIGDNEYLSVFFAIGYHIEAHPFWVDIDAMHRMVNVDYSWEEEYNDQIESIRVTVGFRVHDELSVFAGPSLNLLVSENMTQAGLIPAFMNTTSNGYNISMWPGLTAGIQWEPRTGSLNAR